MIAYLRVFEQLFSLTAMSRTAVLVTTVTCDKGVILACMLHAACCMSNPRPAPEKAAICCAWAWAAPGSSPGSFDLASLGRS